MSTNTEHQRRARPQPGRGRRSTVPAGPVSISEVRVISDDAGAHTGDLIVTGLNRHLRGDHLQGAASKRVAQHWLRRAILVT